MERFRYPLSLFITSFVMLVIGLFLKIMHWPGGQLIMGSMLMVQVVSVIWLIVLLLTQKRKP